MRVSDELKRNYRVEINNNKVDFICESLNSAKY